MMTTREAIDGSAVFERSPNVVFRNVGPDAVLVPVRRNVGDLDAVYTLSPVAVLIWNLLDGKRSIDDIVTAICDEFDVDRTAASADVAEFVADLSEAALISQGKRP